MIRYLPALVVAVLSGAGVLLVSALNGSPHLWRGAAYAAVLGFVIAGFYVWATGGDRDA